MVPAFVCAQPADAFQLVLSLSPVSPVVATCADLQLAVTIANPSDRRVTWDAGTFSGLGIDVRDGSHRRIMPTGRWVIFHTRILPQQLDPHATRRLGSILLGAVRPNRFMPDDCSPGRYSVTYHLSIPGRGVVNSNTVTFSVIGG